MVNMYKNLKRYLSLLSQFNWDNKSKILQELDRVVPRTFENTSFTQEVEQETSDRGGFDNLSKEEIVAYLVNKGMDGDMDVVNAHEDKVARGKAKAMIVKIKRGAAEKPKMPEISGSPQNDNNLKTETKEEIMTRLIPLGLDGNMDEINALEDRVLRGKIKAAIVRAKRDKK